MTEAPTPEVMERAYAAWVEANSDGCLLTDDGARFRYLPAIARALMEERAKALNEGYLAGFMASGEGWNGEYPLPDPKSDAHWAAARDQWLAAAIRGGQDA